MNKKVGGYMKINPVYLKELKTSVRTMKTSMILLGYNGLLALFGLFAFLIIFRFDIRNGGVIEYAAILKVYFIIGAVEFALMLFIIPSITAASIASEREKQTLELLLITKQSPLQVIIGKLLSSISTMVLLAFSSLPILALVFSIGGISISDLLEFMILIIVTAIYIGSIGLFFSTLFKKTTFATVSTYGSVLFLTIGTLVILWGISLLYQFNVSDSLRGYESGDIGNLLYFLLINPAITCFSMIESQIGTGSSFIEFFSYFGTISGNVLNYWFIISLIVQLTISGILIWISSLLLDPLRKKSYKGNKGIGKKD